MDEQLRQILIDLLASEDSTGCDGDLTVVASSPIHQLREYMRPGAMPMPVANDARKHHWHIEVSVDGLVHLTLTQHIAALVASALEIVNPDSGRKKRNARALALALQHMCGDI
jgi:hypothetical protein